jgi:hypothetical protein
MRLLPPLGSQGLTTQTSLGQSPRLVDNLIGYLLAA